MPSPQPPFFAAAVVAPYNGRRTDPIAIDFVELTASGRTAREVSVSSDVHDLLSREEREAELRSPILIDGSDPAETVFRRGAKAADYCRHQKIEATLLVRASAVGGATSGQTLAVIAWPSDLAMLEEVAPLLTQEHRWGMIVPVVYPLTTDLSFLSRVVDLTAASGGSFLASTPLDLDQSARHALAALPPFDQDDEVYATLFHHGLDTLIVATERHIAALAAERKLEDLSLPWQMPEVTNWEAAARLASAGSRLTRIGEDVELGWRLLKASSVVATVRQPLRYIAETASLSIIPSLEEPLGSAVAQWLRSHDAPLFSEIDRRFRLRRDAGL